MLLVINLTSLNEGLTNVESKKKTMMNLVSQTPKLAVINIRFLESKI